MNYITNTLPSLPDQRDIPFVPSVWPPEKFASFVDLMPDVEEVESQLEIGSCVGNGLCSQCESLGKSQGNSYDLSRLFLYTATLDYTNRLGQEGLVPRDAYKVAYKYGICPENGPEGYPYDTSKAAVRPPDQYYVTAYKTRVERYESVAHYSVIRENQDIVNRIKSALNEGLHVGIALKVDESIRSMTGPWRTHKYNLSSQTKNSIGGHYMVIIGYDDSVGMFLVQNSWGALWGDGGFGGFPYSIVGEGFFEAWVVRAFDGNLVKEKPGIKFESINRFRCEARITPEDHEIGKTVSIWIGAKMPDGPLFLKCPVTEKQLTDPTQSDTSGNADKAVLYEGGIITPVLKDYVLKADNLIRVIHWTNLTPFAGADLFLAYGTDPMSWKIEKVCTVPTY